MWAEFARPQKLQQGQTQFTLILIAIRQVQLEQNVLQQVRAIGDACAG